MIVEEVQVYLLVDLHFDCYVNNNLKFQKLHLIVTWGGGGGGGVSLGTKCPPPVTSTQR